MKLAEYLAVTKLHKATFAARLGVSTMAVHLWAAGLRIPRPAHMRKIEKATAGVVQPNDFHAGEAAE